VLVANYEDTRKILRLISYQPRENLFGSTDGLVIRLDRRFWWKALLLVAWVSDRNGLVLQRRSCSQPRGRSVDAAAQSTADTDR